MTDTSKTAKIIKGGIMTAYTIIVF